MGEIVCQTCEKTIAHFEDEKVTKLYGVCTSGCGAKQNSKKEARKTA